MAQVSWSKQLLLAGVVVALGGVVLWHETKFAPQKEEKEEQTKKLFVLKDTQVKDVKLFDGTTRYEIQCAEADAKLCKPGENAKWQLISPLKVKADDSNANALISALNNLTTTETIDLKDETAEKRSSLLKDYGLDPASRSQDKKLTVSTSKGEFTVYLGNAHPMGEGLFAVLETAGKTDESKVFIVPSYFKANFDHNLTYWREKKLLSLAASEVTGFTLNGTKDQISGTRKESQWNLTSHGEEFAGDIENIDNLISGAAFLNAKDFVSDNKSDESAKKALQGAKQLVALTLIHGAPAALTTTPAGKPSATPAGQPSAATQSLTLTLFEKPAKEKGAQAKYYATVSTLDPLFELEAGAKDRLDKSAKDLRLTKLMTSMDRFTAKRIEFGGAEIGTPPLVVQNKDGKWVSDQLEIDHEKIQALLDKLSGNRIQEFLQGAKIPSGEDKALHVTLGDDKEPRKRELAFWKNGGKLYARDTQSKRKEAFLVDSAIQPALPWDRTFLKKGLPKPGASAVPASKGDFSSGEHSEDQENEHDHAH